MEPSTIDLEKKRLSELYSYQILDTEDDEDYYGIAELASDICETPVSLITFLDEKRQWFKSNFGFKLKEIPLEHSFCIHTIFCPENSMVIEDLSNDERFKNNPFVKNGPKFTFYTGISIFSEDKIAIGSLCVLDYKPKKISDKQLTQLKKLANQIEKLLELRKAKLRLASYQEVQDKQIAYNYSLFKAIPDTIIILDYEGRILEVKSGKKEDLALQIENFIDKRVEDLFPDTVSELYYKYLDKIKNNLPYKLLEYKLNTKNGIQSFEANFARFEDDKVLVIIRNISKSKAIEEELFRTKDILLEAGKMAKIGAWEVDFINQTHLWSEVTKDILELGENPIPTVEEGIKLYENDPEGLEKITAAFNNAIYEGTSYDLNLRVKTIQGNIKWVRTIGKPIFENHLCVGVFGTFQDITEIKNKEEALKEKTLEYEHLFFYMNQGVVYQDDKGHIISANPAAERILGISVSQMLGRTSVDPRWHAIRQDGSPFPGEEHPAMQALKSGKPVLGQVMGIFSPEKNNYRWILVDALPEMTNGKNPKPKSVLATFTDITDLLNVESKLKENEANLSAIIESSSESIWSVDREYRVIFANNTFKELFQESFGQKIELQENVLNKIPKEMADFWVENYDKAFNGETINFNFEIGDSSEKMHYSVTVTPISIDEKIIGASIFAKDITDNMRHILEIEKQNSKLKEIAWKQSHLVRAPLARIMGLAYLIGQEKNSLENVQQLIQFIGESSVDLDNVIRSIVEISTQLQK